MATQIGRLIFRLGFFHREPGEFVGLSERQRIHAWVPFPGAQAAGVYNSKQYATLASPPLSRAFWAYPRLRRRWRTLAVAKLNGILETALYFDDMEARQALLRGGDGAQTHVRGPPPHRLRCWRARRAADLQAGRLGADGRDAGLARSLGTMARDPCIWLSPSMRISLPLGRKGSRRTVSRSKGASIGSAAGKASISAIPKATSSSLRRRASGQLIKRGSTH